MWLAAAHFFYLLGCRCSVFFIESERRTRKRRGWGRKLFGRSVGGAHPFDPPLIIGWSVRGGTRRVRDHRGKSCFQTLSTLSFRDPRDQLPETLHEPCFLVQRELASHESPPSGPSAGPRRSRVSVVLWCHQIIAPCASTPISVRPRGAIHFCYYMLRRRSLPLPYYEPSPPVCLPTSPRAPRSPFGPCSCPFCCPLYWPYCCAYCLLSWHSLSASKKYLPDNCRALSRNELTLLCLTLSYKGRR